MSFAFRRFGRNVANHRQMHRPNTPISLADLSAAGVRLRPYEAVTLVHELMLQVARGEVAGVPSAHVIRLSASGTVSVEGPVGAGGRPIMRAAQLLDSLLPASDAGNQFRVPGGLKLVVARALGTLDLPPFTSLEAFADALSRFSATNPAATVTNLVVTWSEFVGSRAPEAPDPIRHQRSPGLSSRSSRPADRLSWVKCRRSLTVSDIRRARRATGAPLAHVAARSRIPVGLLRQLEWGYLVNWPAGQYGRTQLIRYARASGLDEQLVLSTIEPLLEEAESRRSLVQWTPPVDALVVASGSNESLSDPIVEIEEIAVSPAQRDLPLQWPVTASLEPPTRTRTKVLAALAIPALLAISLVPAWWAHSMRRAPDTNIALEQSATRVAPRGRWHRPRHPGALRHLRPHRLMSQQETVNRHLPRTRRPVRRARSESDRRAPLPDARLETDSASPAYRLAADGGAFSQSLASVGTAMFYHPDDEGRATLMRGDTDSRGAVLRITRIVDDSARNFHLRPSPDGSRIAFDSDRGGVRGVYVADADGRNVQRISPEGWAAIPSWSPDGSTLAFVREDDKQPEVWNLWTIDLSSRQLKQVTRHRYGQPWGGSWFSDGRRLAYAHGDRLIVRDLRSDAERVFVYHQPDDEFSPDWNFTGMIQDAELLHAVGLRLANSAEWPNWSQDSEFRAARDASAAERGGTAPAPTPLPAPDPAKPGERG